MSRTIVNFWLDTLMLLLFLTLIWSSVVIRYVFPAYVDAAGWRLWGGGYAQWLDFQFVVLCLLALGVLLHLMLHWNWVCGVVTSRFLRRKEKGRVDDGSRTIVGVGMLIVLLNLMGIGIAAAALTIQGPAG